VKPGDENVKYVETGEVRAGCGNSEEQQSSVKVVELWIG
jgi:hypothetical protein